jgi:hypothetical protein
LKYSTPSGCIWSIIICTWDGYLDILITWVSSTFIPIPQNYRQPRTFSVTPLRKVWVSPDRFFTKLTIIKRQYVEICCTSFHTDRSRNMEDTVRNLFTRPKYGCHWANVHET